MKVIVAGSRTINDQKLVDSIITESGFDITTLVSGTCRGVDQCGENWAERNNISIARFPARWSALGLSAGPVRNKQMADYADAAIVIIDKRPTSPASRGARNMMETAIAKGIPLHLHEVN